MSAFTYAFKLINENTISFISFYAPPTIVERYYVFWSVCPSVCLFVRLSVLLSVLLQVKAFGQGSFDEDEVQST